VKRKPGTVDLAAVRKARAGLDAAIRRWPSLTSGEAQNRLVEYLKNEKGTEDAQEQARKGKRTGRANRRPTGS